ncbi:hypothetical protein AVEN_77123-1 [Araneus ventricosus]|uniref:Uncharacterized protein n=1 Tax=Araneus ventricosus TaxID=182803 RepID=A0A4Y2IPG8_ARAVE|nr:hypothetical protein AVEN_77123-1 [Araneus ventricosus]
MIDGRRKKFSFSTLGMGLGDLTDFGPQGERISTRLASVVGLRKIGIVGKKFGIWACLELGMRETCVVGMPDEFDCYVSARMSQICYA